MQHCCPPAVALGRDCKDDSLCQIGQSRKSVAPGSITLSHQVPRAKPKSSRPGNESQHLRSLGTNALDVLIEFQRRVKNNTEVSYTVRPFNVDSVHKVVYDDLVLFDGRSSITLVAVDKAPPPKSVLLLYNNFIKHKFDTPRTRLSNTLPTGNSMTMLPAPSKCSAE
ncbi:hypothetical protein J6590_071931 [Homalodisca vitripennis]|nr:hypothetical protein J6590_071931 [Homalodisca vitripennis]